MANAKVTAVLVTWWKRDVRPVEAYLRGLGCFHDVLVWRNTPAHNRKQYGRYLRMQTVETDLIYTQDDDCIVLDVPKLLCEHCKHNYRGATNYLTQHCIDNFLPRWMPCNMYGWGAVFHKGLLAGIDEYLRTWPADALFHREVDYVFPGMVPDGLSLTLPGEHIDFPSATDKDASWRLPETMSNLREIVKRVRACRTMKKS